jgi:hypothetical protein
MWLYINYPNPHFTIHRNPSCHKIRVHHVSNQRVSRVTSSNRVDFLSRLENIRFAAQRGLNDIWIVINLDTPEQELNLVKEIQAVIGCRYRPLSGALQLPLFHRTLI